MANSSSYKAMVTSTNKLVDAMVAGNPAAISGDLVAQELIHPDVYQEMLLLDRSNPDKARILVQGVTNQVRYKPEVFSKFLGVLHKNSLSDLVDMLEKKM